MWMALRGYAGKSRPVGALRINRRRNSQGLIELQVAQITNMGGPTRSERIRAEIVCSGDRLCTPESWTMRSRIFDAQGTAVPLTHVTTKGDTASGTITISGTGERKVFAPQAFTAGWCLFDAVQRLPFDLRPLSFTMLDDMELPKRNQRLSPGRSMDVRLGGRIVSLHSFEQVGEGILPYTYWLDEQHRLLMAIGGLRTFLFDPKVEIPEDEV